MGKVTRCLAVLPYCSDDYSLTSVVRKTPPRGVGFQTQPLLIRKSAELSCSIYRDCGDGVPKPRDTLRPSDDAKAVPEMLPDCYAGSTLRGGDLPCPDRSELRTTEEGGAWDGPRETA